MPDQDPRDRWFVGPLALTRRTAVGVAAGLGSVGIVVVVLLAVVASDGHDARLHIEGVGEVEGPLLVYVETGRDYSVREFNDRWHIAVHDLGTGKEWVAMELESGEDTRWRATNQVVVGGPYWVVVAGKSLLQVSPAEIRRVSLDGRTESVVAELSKWPSSHPRASPDGTMVLFLDHTYAIVVLDLQSGDDVLRVEPDAPRVEALGRQWPLVGTFPLWGPDGEGILLWSHRLPDRPLPSVVLTLDGDLHALPEGATVSEDLHYAIRGQPLTADEPRYPAPDPWYLYPWLNSRVMGFSGSFEVVELRSGRVLRTVSAGEGHSLWYVWSSPGRIYYVVSPRGSDEISPEIRALDVATGETSLVSGEQMFEESDSAFSPELRLAVWDARHVECFEVTASARATCEPLAEAAVEVLSPPHLHEKESDYLLVGREFLDLIWLD